MKKIIALILIIITAIPSGTRAAIDPQRTRVVQRYKPLAWVSGVDSGLRLYIHEKSLNLDLAKTNEIRLRVKVSPLFNSKDQISSFKIILKDAETGDFITSQNLTISRSHRGSRVISFNAGFFKSATKTLDIELYDTANYLLNTYTTTLSAANVTSQITGGVSEIGPEANCTSTNFGECQVDYFLQKVTFEARPQRQISTRVYKSENGFYKVSVAVPKKPFDELGLRFKRKGRSRPSSGGGASTTSFGETLDISQINIGSSNSDAVNITNNSGNIVFSGATNRTGKLGIGVNNPQAWLHITGSLNGTPSIILNPGVLSSTTPPNGSIEFDGNKLYFTKNGIRNELGAQGPHGSPGAPGGPGPQGPAGPAGPAGTGSNGTANNMVINNGYLQDPTFNGSILFTDNSVTRFNGRTLFQEGPAPVTVANYGQIFVNGTTSNLMFLDDTGNQYDLLSFANPLTLNGFTSDNFLRSNTSDQYTSGTLTTLTGTTFRVNGDLAIADTNIALTGASTTFTQSTGNIIMNPTGVVDINATTIVDGFRMATGASNTFIMTSNAGGQGSWTNPNSITVGNATNALNAVNSNNLDNLDSTRFLRSDTSDQFTTGSLATLTGTTFRVNGDLDIADTNIILSGASTSFTGTGFLGFSPGAGTNMNINLSGTGDFAVNTNQLYVDTSATNTGFGMTTPNEKITVEGRTSYRETTRPALTANYGKIYVNGTTSNLMFLDDAGAQYDLLTGGAGADAGTLDGIDSLQFLRSDTSDQFTSGTLTTSAGTIFRVNGNLAVADTVIDFTGASTTFNGTAGAISVRPLTGTNFNVNLATTGDFVVNSNHIYADTSTTNVGIGNTNPNTKLTINGNLALRETTAPGLNTNFGKLYVDVTTSNLNFLDDSGTSYDLLNPLFGVGIAGGTNTQIQFNDAGALGGNGDFIFIKGTRTLRVGTNSIFDINSTNVSIADTDISFDGASTTFTGTGFMTLAPGAGSNVNVNLSGTGDFAVNTNQLYVDTSATNTGFGMTTPNEKITVEGRTSYRETTRPALTANYGKIYVNGTTSNLMFLDDAGAQYDLLTGGAGADAGTLDGIDSLQFLRSDTSDQFTSGTLTTSAGTIFRVNGNLAVADTVIDFTGASTIFNGTAGAISARPFAGSNFNVNLSTTGDFVVNNNQIYADTSTTNVGIGNLNPNTKLTINGNLALRETTAPGLNTNFGKLYVDVTTSNLNFLDDSGNNYDLLNPLHGIGIAGGANTQFQFNDAGALSGNGDLIFIKGTRTLRVGTNSIFDINSTNVSIADTDIVLDGASTTFSQGSGFISLVPGSGTNLNVSLAGTGDFAVNTNQLYVDTSATNTGFGLTNPNEKITVQGRMSLSETTRPGFTANYGKLYVNGATSNLMYLDDSGVQYDITTSGGGTPGGSNTWFQFNNSGTFAGNGSLTFTTATRTLAVAANALLDINSTTVSIADSNIDFDSGSGVTFTPTAGQNLNIALATTGDFAVNTNQLYVDTSATNTGFGIVTPNEKVTVNGNLSLREGSAPVATANFGKLFVSSTTSNLVFMDDAGASFDLLAGFSGGTVAGGSNSQFQFNDSGVLAGNGALTFTKATKTLSIPTDAPLDINSTSVSIADTNITLDGASTTFTQTTGAISLVPASGTNLNITLATTGDFAVNTNQLYVDTSATNVGVGTTTPVEKLQVAGTVQSTGIKMTTGAAANAILVSDAVGLGSWTSPTALNIGNASNLDSLDSTQFLRSDTSDNYTSGTLTLDPGTSFDVNSTNVSIVDTNITFDGASTTFTGTGFMTMLPGAGTNLNVTLSGTGDFAVNTNQLYVDTSATNTGFGWTTPNERVTINGNLSLREGSAPIATANFGKLFVNSTTSNLVFMDDAGASFDLLAGFSGGTVAGGANTQFQFNDAGVLAGNGALIFTKASKTLAIAADAPLDINSTSVSIADTDITLDGASTTFTQNTGLIALAPAAGNNLNVTLSGAGDFAVNTNQLYVDTSATNTGFGWTTPNEKITVNGNLSLREGSAPVATANFGKLFVSSTTSNLVFMDDAGASFDLLAGFSGGTVAGGANTQFQFNDSGVLAGNGALIFTKASKTLTVDSTAPLDINSTSVSIADTNITLDGASTTFTGTGFMTLQPGAGTNLNVTLSGAGDFAVNTNQLYVDTSATNVGVGTTTPAEKLQVAGTIRSTGIMMTTGAAVNAILVSDAVGLGSWTNPTALNIGNASNLDSLDSSQFLRSDTSDQFTSGTLTLNAGTTFDVDSTNVSIADTNITLDGASTTFTGTGFMTMQPGAGTNLNVTLSGAGDFAVNTNQLYVDTSATNTGFGMNTPNEKITVEGRTSLRETTRPAATANYGKLYVNGTTSNLMFLDDAGSQFDLLGSSGGGVSAIDDLSDAKTDVGSVFLGAGAGLADPGTTQSTAVGIDALRSNANNISGPGIQNTAIGYRSQYLTNGGVLNTSTGAFSMSSNIGGSYNTAMGNTSMQYNNLGSYNAAFGYSSLSSNVNGNYNTALGYNAGTNLISGSSNILIGANINTPTNSTSNHLNIGDSIFGDLSSKNIGIGINSTFSKLALNGNLAIRETVAPTSTANFGKLFVSSTTSNLMFMDDAGASFDLLAGFTGGTVAGGSDSQFQFNDGGMLAGNGALAFTKASRTLTVAANAPLDINSISVSIADTDITLDGASTTFTQSTGLIALAPAAGSNLNVTLSGAGDFAVNTNQLYVDTSATNVGVGTTSPAEKLQVAGTVQSTGLKMTTGAAANAILVSDAVGLGSWTNPTALSIGNASNLDSLDSSQFLRSDTSDNYTSGTLTLDPGTTFDVNSTNVSIVDTNITFDGASTTFTGTGFMTMLPGAGTNLNVTLSGTGDFAVNTNQLYVDTSATNVGVGLTNPNEKITVEGRTSLRETTRPAATANYGKLYVNGTTSNLMFLDDAGSQFDLLGGGGSGVTKIDDLLDAATDMHNNLYVGNGSGLSSTMNYNTGLGIRALELAPSGQANTAIGFQSMSSASNSDFNVAVGAATIRGAFSDFNVAVGYAALNGSLSSAFRNTSLGYQAGTAMTQGDNNTLIGSNAGDSITTGSNNIIIGYNADAPTNSTSNFINIGSTIYGDSSSATVSIGKTSTTAKLEVNGSLALTPTSDILLTAGSTIPSSNSIINISGNLGPIDLTSNPQIADGTHGQIIIIKGTSNTNTVTLDDGTGLSLTNGLNVVLGNRDTLTLMYDATDDLWIEITRSNK